MDIRDEINLIMSGYNPKTDKEIETVPRIGALIASKLEQYRMLQWTEFPKIFRSVKCDAALYRAINDFNGWCKEIGFDFEKAQTELESELKSINESKSNTELTSKLTSESTSTLELTQESKPIKPKSKYVNGKKVILEQNTPRGKMQKLEDGTILLNGEKIVDWIDLDDCN